MLSPPPCPESLNKCAYCGEPCRIRFCSPEHWRLYRIKVVVGSKNCMVCGAEFSYTTHTSSRKTCSQACRTALTQARRQTDFGVDVSDETRKAPPHIRVGYCVRTDEQTGKQSRCKLHLEPECRLRLEKGLPVCRVER